MDEIVMIVALFVVVVWAMIGINLENELYLIPIILAHVRASIFLIHVAVALKLGETRATANSPPHTHTHARSQPGLYLLTLGLNVRGMKTLFHKEYANGETPDS